MNSYEIAAENVGVGEENGEQYENVKKPAANQVVENTYDIYEASPSLDDNKCPYTGLPAAHLKLMNSPQVGLLTRIEKKIFFAQEKDFYAGILGKWILLYPSKSNDMKPSEYFYPISLEMEKSDNHFSLVTDKRKKFIFHAPNSEEFNGWIESIKDIIEHGESCQLREKERDSMTGQFRKLPSPPLEDDDDNKNGDRVSSENYYGFNRSSNQTVINTEERLYEEPSRAVQKQIIEIDAGTTENSENEDAETADDENLNPTIPPSLPAKTGKKTIDATETHSYDIPKPTKSIERDDVNFNESEKFDKSRSRVSEMTAILSTTMNLVSPEEMRKSSPTKKTNLLHENQAPLENEKRVSPMKVWFSKHMKIRRRRKNSSSKQENTPKTEDELLESVAEDSTKVITVNSIVNMFEKNGHFKNLSKNLKFKESEDYETVCVGSYKI